LSPSTTVGFPIGDPAKLIFATPLCHKETGGETFTPTILSPVHRILPVKTEDPTDPFEIPSITASAEAELRRVIDGLTEEFPYIRAEWENLCCYKPLQIPHRPAVWPSDCRAGAVPDAHRRGSGSPNYSLRP
jgi:hypothetical protein